MEPKCKHCGLQIHRTASGYVHTHGAQRGLGTCALTPYGFHAEPVGSECDADPANPCMGARLAAKGL